MGITIALAGNPNSGKTTMFNALTGSAQHVGNWPGVTVEKKDGRLKGSPDVIMQDLPGIYSLSPYTLEEVVTRNYLIQEKPDAIINIVDASNLERNLYLTTQLLEIGIPMVIALNMMDVVQKNGIMIQTQKLANSLGCKIVETSAVKGLGGKEATEKAIAAASAKAVPSLHPFSKEVEAALSAIESLIEGKTGSVNPRWYSVKLFERDQEAGKNITLTQDVRARIENLIVACEKAFDDDSESIITNERYGFIAQLMRDCVRNPNQSKLSTSDKIDQVITNRWLALPIFALVMYLVYYISISTVGAWMTDWVNDGLFGDIIPHTFGAWLEGIGTAAWLHSLIMDGIVAGVGAVVGFLPQMLVLFLCLAILEDCGYMARIAFVLDRVFRRFGLSGKSFIPVLISTGCGVPGIMAARTIEKESDRRMTVMTTTFMPCGAKLPIIALIAGALFPESTWVGPSSYFIGMAAIILSGLMLKKTKLFAGDPSPFVMELPSYHWPRVKGVLRVMYERGLAFVKKAGTLVLLATVLVWFMQGFNWSFRMVETEESILASVGRGLAPLFRPLGWGDWRAAIATITGFMAKENIVGTFGILYGFAEVAEDGAEYWPQLVLAFSQLSAFSFLLFNLLCAPCFAAMGALRREMMSDKWTAFAIAYQMVFAYCVSFVVYQLGMLFTGHGFGIGSALAIGVIAYMCYMIFRKGPDASRNTVRRTMQKAV